MDYGAWSLLPPLVAIVLAIALRQVFLPLIVAVLVAAFLLADLQSGATRALTTTASGFFGAIWNSFSDYDHLRALVFSLTLGGMVGVLETGGGMVALVNRFAARIRSRRGAQTLITALGLGIFFDDYASTLLVGGTMRTTADRFGVSRAKLAYLVDTTSAPVAGLSPISTWVVTEISYVASGLAAASLIDFSAFALLMASLPYRFYPLLALVMVFTVAISDRDFGPMRNERPVKSGDDSVTTAARVLPARLAWAAIVPITSCVLVVLGTLFSTGGGSLAQLSDLRQLGHAFGNGDSYHALICGGVTGLVLSILLHCLLGQTMLRSLLLGAVRGASHMLPAMGILWLAWALSDQTSPQQLATGTYIAGWLGESMPNVLLPTAVFLIASGVSFSTGTSWGTMAILTPIAMQLGIAASNGQPDAPISLATLGAVLAGAIFGDHCSPISDTTVLSSQASGCDHVTHVRTQMPYALMVGVLSIVLGLIPVAYGASPYWCLAIGAATTIGLVLFVGQRPDADAVSEETQSRS